jgi:hypothetical protein
METMNQLELGKHWISKLGRVLPSSSTRIRTRLAWHLAALSVRSDEELAAITDFALAKSVGKSEQLIEMRRHYLHTLSIGWV